MPRSPRITEPGVVYHLLNRRVMRMRLFDKDGDYETFERVLAESLGRPDAPALLSYCLMPNHWHFAVLAGRHTDLSTWMQRVTVTHTHRWRAHHHNAGDGPLYQGRFKSFPCQKDVHFLTLCRYIEANARRAKLVKRAEDWRWSSLWVRGHGKSDLAKWLRDWPVARPRNWVAEVNRRMDEEALEKVRKSLLRGVPLGSDSWAKRIAAALGLEITLRPRGRPRKGANNSS